MTHTKKETHKKHAKKKATGNPYAVPLSIVIAGAFIALAIFLASGSTQNTAQAPEPQKDTTSKVRPVTARDHFKGDKNASVTIVEYSDFECPFCKRIHETMNTIIDTEKDVKWVFRHFPLDQLHPRNARKAAVASECVNELGGNDAFWKFTDEYFNTTQTNDRWNIADELPRLVGVAGVDKKAFDTCYASGKYDAYVQADVDNGAATGGRGTPWSVVIMKSGKTVSLNGAQPESAIRQIIDFARKN